MHLYIDLKSKRSKIHWLSHFKNNFKKNINKYESDGNIHLKNNEKKNLSEFLERAIIIYFDLYTD